MITETPIEQVERIMMNDCVTDQALMQCLLLRETERQFLADFLRYYRTFPFTGMSEDEVVMSYMRHIHRRNGH